VGFEPTTCGSEALDFHDGLVSQGKTKTTIRENLSYAKRLGYILDAGDASELIKLSPRNKHQDRLQAVRFVLYRPNKNLENFFSNLIQCRQSS
jgi:hypothetical protein